MTLTKTRCVSQDPTVKDVCVSRDTNDICVSQETNDICIYQDTNEGKQKVVNDYVVLLCGLIDKAGSR